MAGIALRLVLALEERVAWTQELRCRTAQRKPVKRGVHETPTIHLTPCQGESPWPHR